ncbi:uncharacterized protein LOC103061706 isoform X1 [Python bivittatus]|uniref:Uncharacterized protein LOC103061706 isoform X1 n=2 Tax=Python bivittatus TaxID=176946 RepID=A0A9F5ITW3_PYTBI|nr:uncharacterized protein LOC103061706 isoform X1 [Python bivittatus]
MGAKAKQTLPTWRLFLDGVGNKGEINSGADLGRLPIKNRTGSRAGVISQLLWKVSCVEMEEKPNAANPETGKSPTVPQVGSQGEFWERTVPKFLGKGNWLDIRCQCFKDFCYWEGEGPREICSRLHQFYRQWLKPEKNTKAQMLDLMILKQFLAILPPEIENWIKDCGAETTSQAVALAEGFLLSQAEDKKQMQWMLAKTPTELPKAGKVPLDVMQKLLLRGIVREESGEATSLGRKASLEFHSIPTTGAVETVAIHLDLGTVSFQEVAVDFSEDEWALLNSAQKALYREVMEENYLMVSSLAPEHTRQLEDHVSLPMEGEEVEGDHGLHSSDAHGNNPTVHCALSPASTIYLQLEALRGVAMSLHSIASCIQLRLSELANEEEEVIYQLWQNGARRRRFLEIIGRWRRRSAEQYRMLIQALTETVPLPRRWWVYPARRRWWRELVLTVWDDEMWIANFRMSRATLFEVADRLRPLLQRQNTVLRIPIAVEERVAITVWWLATQASYREVAHQFGIGRTTVGNIVVEVCLAIELLLKCTVCLGDHQKIMDGFGAMGFPHCVGAVDRCHIPICAPYGQREQCVNRKNYYLMLLQGTVDHTGRFIDIEVGYSGTHRDAFMFRNSSLCKAMDAGVFVPGNPTMTYGGVTIPPLILGDDAYPLRRWLMKPFVGRLGHREMLYNRVFHRCRNVVERAFGRLKARWHCLTMQLPVAEENVVSVISSCVVLHNICETKGHPVTWTPDSEVPPFTVPVEDCKAHSQRHTAEAKAVRSAVADFLLASN